MTVYINGTTGYSGPVGTIGDLTTTGNTTLGDASGDTLTINGSTTTLTQGTANGVAYLNGSKALTTGSALVFDGTNLGVGVTPISLGAGYTNLTISNATNGGGVTFAVGNTAKASIFNAGNNLYIDRSNAAGVMYFRNTANGTTDITLDASGNLGIGTSSPGYKLEVNGNAYFSNITLPSAGVTIGTGSLGSIAGAAIQMFGVGAGTYMTLFTNGSERVRIDSSGNLLVGTTSASYSSSGRGLIEVNGSSQSLIAFKIGGGTTNAVYQYNTTTSFETNVTGSRFLNWTVNGSERARITSSGNFGIATAAPAYTLDVNGSMRCSWKISNGVGYGYGYSSTWTTIFTIPSSSDGSFWARMHAYNIENGATSHFTFYFSAVIRHNGSPYSDFYGFASTAEANLQGASGSAYAQFRFTDNGVTNGPLYFQAYNTTYYNVLYVYDIYAYGISPSWS